MFFYSSPSWSTQFIAFFALIPYFISIHKSPDLKKTAISSAVFSLALTIILSTPLLYAGIVNYGSSIHYVLFITLLLVILPAALIYIFFGLTIHILKSRYRILNLLLPPALWIITDYIREIFIFFIPWGFIGYSQVFTPFIQIADITGIYGVSFIVVLVNSILADFFIREKRKIADLLPVFIILITLLIYGILKERIINDCTSEEIVNITGIQGNTGSLERWDSNLSFMTYRHYIDLTEKNFNSPGIAVWPETVLNSSERINIDIIKSVNSIIGDDSLFVAGGTRKNADGNTFNSIFISSGGMLNHIYDKKILFPYSEREFAGLSHGGVMGSPDTFEKGDSSSLYKHKNLIIGLSICFESLYPSFIRKTVAQGAEILINVANDSWFGNTYEPHMHLYSNIVRAVENRRYIARITNSGVSAVITPAGRLSDSLDLNKEGAIRGTVKKINHRTFYTISGDIIIIISTLIIMALVIIYILEPSDS